MSENTASAKAQEDQVVDKKIDKKQGAGSQPSFDMDELRALADLVDEHGFTDFEFENENIRVRLSRTVPSQIVQSMPMAMPMEQPAASAQTSATHAASEAEVDPDAGLTMITSPIVGTFYRAPGPDKDPYVSEGSAVSPETTVCIVEAMKLMNEIQAEISGEIVKIYAENGQPVEFGQPLFGVRK